MKWNKEQLWKLRQEVPIGSLFIQDYNNSFGVDPWDASEFFDGYLDSLEDKMEYQISGFKDAEFWKRLSKFDYTENLEDWYECFENEPLPIETT